MKKQADPALLERVKRLLRQKGKTWAVKEYRDATNVGLKEALDFVNTLEEEEQLAHPYQDVEWVPANCPNCAAALNNDMMNWIDESTARCPACGSTLRDPEA